MKLSRALVALFFAAEALQPCAQTVSPLLKNPAPSPAVNKAAASDAGGSDANLIRVLLIPDKETTLSSTIASKIAIFNMTLGQDFKTGDLLIGFDCEEAAARLEMAKAEFAGAVEQHEAKVKMQGLGQASDIEVALAASVSNKAKAQMSLNQTQVSQCSLHAPWNGRVARVNVRNFMTVTPGQPLMELVSDGPLRIKLNAPSRLMGKLRPGAKFEVQIDETRSRYPAAVTAINSRVDPVSQTIEVEARLVRHHRELLPGMSGVADLSIFQ
jgi:membrane fusion protein, multidrug efflux system